MLSGAPCEAVANVGRATDSVPLQLALSASGELVAARWHNPVVSAPLAPLTHLSGGHFIRAFRQTAGCTPWQYVLDLRLESAVALLLQGLASAEVAHRVGLGNAARLSRLFRERRGVALSSLRGMQHTQPAPPRSQRSE